MNNLHPLPEALSLPDHGALLRESPLMPHSLSLAPPCPPYLNRFHVIIRFHFQFGFGNQDRPFQFLQEVPGTRFSPFFVLYPPAWDLGDTHAQSQQSPPGRAPDLF